MPSPSETLPVLDQRLTDRLLDFDRLGQRPTARGFASAARTRYGTMSV